MGESSPGTPTSVRPPDDRLDSWKEIAAYLDRDVTKVQRWEKREGMPVSRNGVLGRWDLGKASFRECDLSGLGRLECLALETLVALEP